MSEIREKTIEGIAVGTTFEVFRTFTADQVADFAAISRDDNPIHSDPRFIASKQMKGPICHGLLVASMLTEIGGQIGWLASGMDMRFLKPVYIGETVRCVFTVDDIGPRNKAKASVRFYNQHNELVLEARLTGILPNAQEREILRDLL